MHIRKGKEDVNIPKKRLKWTRRQKDLIDIVEIGEVSIDLQDPIRLHQQHGDDVEPRDPLRQERSILHPRDDFVQAPGDVEAYCCDGEVPAISWFVGEDPCSVPHGEDKLDAFLFKIIRELSRDHAYLCQNQLVKQIVLLHVGNGHCSHDQKRAYHQALTPGLKHQPVRVRRTSNTVR